MPRPSTVPHAYSEHSFDPDAATPVEPAPVLFKTLRVPCSCGRTLVGTDYHFFGSTLFIRGCCVICGDRTAIFAPEMNESHDQKMERAKLEFVEAINEFSARYSAHTSTSAHDVARELTPSFATPGIPPATTGQRITESADGANAAAS